MTFGPTAAALLAGAVAVVLPAATGALALVEAAELADVLLAVALVLFLELQPVTTMTSVAATAEAVSNFRFFMKTVSPCRMFERVVTGNSRGLSSAHTVR
ncbi:MAG TPA: hypothetical protein VIL94_01060 [Acidothermaceae bacterium]